MATRALRDSHAVVIASGAASVRRAVGPSAWVVLECLVACAVRQDGQTVSHRSVRGLASELGLAKDTVARAVRRLIDEELVRHVERRDQGGRFGTGYYRLTVPHDVLAPLDISAHSHTSSAQAPTGRARRTSNTAQMSLIDFEPPD